MPPKGNLDTLGLLMTAAKKGMFAIALYTNQTLLQTLLAYGATGVTVVGIPGGVPTLEGEVDVEAMGAVLKPYRPQALAFISEANAVMNGEHADVAIIQGASTVRTEQYIGNIFRDKPIGSPARVAESYNYSIPESLRVGWLQKALQVARS